MRPLSLPDRLPPGEAAAAKAAMARRLLQSGEGVDDVAEAVRQAFRMRREPALRLVQEQQRRL